MGEYESDPSENGYQYSLAPAQANEGSMYPFWLSNPNAKCGPSEPSGICPPGYSCYGGQCVQPVRETGPFFPGPQPYSLNPPPAPIVFKNALVAGGAPPMWKAKRAW